MKKFLVAAAASLLIFCGQTQATPVDDLNAQIETQEMESKWTHFRDKYLLGRETENERRDRKDWERRHRYDPPPSSRYRNDRRYYPPPPPPSHYRDGKRYYPPPPPPPPTRRR